jgi:acyl-CoA-binding protein
MESSGDVVVQSQSSNVSAPVSSNTADNNSYSSPASQTADERIFKQSEVNDIVKKAKYGAVEDFKRISQQQPDYAQNKYGNNANQPAQQPAYQQNTPQNIYDVDQVRRIASEELQRSRDEWVKEVQQREETAQAQRVVNNFYSKQATGKEKYQDFDTITGDIDYAHFPHVVQLLADHVDNAHDLMYEFGKDRLKMDAIENLANRSPNDAIKQMQRLSQSLKDNEAAGKIRTPNEPLSQLRPSNTGTGTGALSVRDLRAKYRA